MVFGLFLAPSATARCYEADAGRHYGSPPSETLTSGDLEMTEATVRTKTTLHCALELSKSSWLLAIQFPDRPQPSLYRIKGGDAAGLMSQLLIARDRCAKATGEAPSTITLC